MLTVIEPLVCLILVQISPGGTSPVRENNQLSDITTVLTFPADDTIIQDVPYELNSNITTTFNFTSAAPPESVNGDTLSPSSQPKPNINRKGYFPSIAANFDDQNVIFVEFFNKWSPLGWMRPFQEKIQKIGEFLTHPNHPGLNFGSFNNFNPQNLINRLHEKGHQLLTGSKVSIYGTRPPVNYDFPFAYRSNKM